MDRLADTGKDLPPSLESNVSRKESVSDLMAPPLLQFEGGPWLCGPPGAGGFISSRDEGVAGPPSPTPVGVGGILVSQLFSPFTEFVLTLGGPSGSDLIGGGLGRSPPSTESSFVMPGPRLLREAALASAATLLFSFFILTEGF